MKTQKAIQFTVHGGLYVLGVPFYIAGIFIAVITEAFIQGFVHMTSKLKQL